jgi:hypothetical protein
MSRVRAQSGQAFVLVLGLLCAALAAALVLAALARGLGAEDEQQRAADRGAQVQQRPVPRPGADACCRT